MESLFPVYFKKRSSFLSELSDFHTDLLNYFLNSGHILNPIEALKAMEKVASHINEMQKIYEDYGAVFDQLVADQSGTEKEVRSLGCSIHASTSRPWPCLSVHHHIAIWL